MHIVYICGFNHINMQIAHSYVHKIVGGSNANKSINIFNVIYQGWAQSFGKEQKR